MNQATLNAIRLATGLNALQATDIIHLGTITRDIIDRLQPDRGNRPPLVGGMEMYLIKNQYIHHYFDGIVFIKS
jgi:hypothetical protein